MTEPTPLQKAIERLKNTMGEDGLPWEKEDCLTISNAAKQTEALQTTNKAYADTLSTCADTIFALQKENEALTHSVQDWQAISESTRAENQRMREALKHTNIFLRDYLRHTVHAGVSRMLDDNQQALSTTPTTTTDNSKDVK